ncbi:MAG: 16S rRNA (uracil(1498)-N(3))-methyltransferase [bacterium]|nr:16S rRNA (uracil(1498)-N(3))-methyltransferase [bacterium]
MTLLRIFLENISDTIRVFDREILRHVYARRLSEGDEVIVCDKSGDTYLYKIKKRDYRDILLERIGPIEFSYPPRNIIYAQALLKPKKLESVITYSTQFGVEAFVFFISKRSSVRDLGVVEKRLERLKKIAKSSAEISMNKPPRIETTSNLSTLLEQFNNYKPLLLYENSQERLNLEWLRINNIKDILLIIGPEGGFEDEEVELVREKGGYILSLGERILTSEVAGFVVLSLLQFGI